MAVSQRAGPTTIQEAWPAQAGRYEDGTGRYGFLGRDTRSRPEAGGD